MIYNVRGENIEVTPALRDYVEKKIGKLERYFENTENVHVHVNLKVYNDKQGKIEVTIPMPQLLLRAEERHDGMYAAIDLVADKLERQIRKHKTRVNRKLRDRDKGAKQVLAVQTSAPVEENEEEEFEIVRTKHFSLKPMDSEEAILQMNLLGHNFLIFTNAETNRTNIVYRRKDGKYGLIEAN